MQCLDFEIRVCDYLDGALGPAARTEVEQHAAGCGACAALLAESRALAAFFDRTPAVEAPADLAARILYRTQETRRASGGARQGWRRWFQPLLAPRFVMGMAMTILSLSMFARLADVQIRQLNPAELSPAAVWSGVSGRAQRIWKSGAAVYDNLRLFYQIATQWPQAEAEETAPPGGGAGTAADPRKIEPLPRPEQKR